MRSSLKFLSFCLIILAISSCSNDQDDFYNPSYSDNPTQNIKNTYIFSIHPLHNPKKLFEVYSPLINYINKSLSSENAILKLEASRSYASYNKKLFARKFHFSLPNPYQTIESLKYGYRIFGKMGDDQNFKGIIIIRKDSQIKNVLDLKGKSISYPAPTALAATMMPQFFLQKNGLNVMTDVNNFYVGSQESSIMNVYLKKTSAASTWPPPWESFIRDRPEIAKELVVKWETKHLLNNGLVIRDDVPKSIEMIVSKILFSLHLHKNGRKILKRMHLGRFEPANLKAYGPVLDFLKTFEKTIRPIRMRP